MTARRQHDVLVDLARRPSLHAGRLGAALREITEAAADTLAVERVGVWFFTPDRQAIRCSELYERTPALHSEGGELTAMRYPVYFKALESERTIAAVDARLDPRTSAFTTSYLDPFGVTSMLDAPIRRLGSIYGVVCFEHTGAPRAWSSDDEHFASSIADLVAMAIDASDRRHAQEALRHRVEFEKLVAGMSTRFANATDDEIDGAIRDALGDIGRFVGAERSHVIILDDDGLGGRMTHEWSASVGDVRAERYGELSAAAFPWWTDLMQRRGSVSFASLDELPPQAVNERRMFERQGVRSAVFVPMLLKKHFIGSVGCSTLAREVQWTEETLALLRITGEMLVSALERRRSYSALRESERRHRLLFERNLAGVYRNAVDGRMLECNDAMARILGYASREELMATSAAELYFSSAERDRFIDGVRVEGGVRGVEVRLRRKDGMPVWVLESAHLVGDALEGTIVDITDRKLAETALRDSEGRYRLMAENSTDLIARTTPNGIFVYASDALRSLLGYEPAEVIGTPIRALIHPDDRPLLRAIIPDAVGRTFSYRAQRKDGSFVWFESTSRALVDAGGQISEIISVSRDITERRRAEEQIEYQAYHDALTGLPNRLLFRDRLTIALAHAKRQQTALVVMFLDLDRFKIVNDTLGHSLGDGLLRVIAERLRSVLREGDTIARMGGDEFTVLLSDLKRTSDAAKIAQKLLESIAQPVRVEGHELYVTTSIGLAVYPNDGDTAELLLKNADSAMYRAKEMGRNSYQLCTPVMNTRAAERLSVENALRRAIEREELVLYFQPLVRLDTRETAGMEALLRWNRPGHGIVPPATFIGIAEESRLIVPIGEWVLREACREARTRNLLRVAVNLSPRQFQQSDLREVVARALDESGLDPRRLELEITESTAMFNTERSIATLAELRELGVSIALDDFGTGHSSLSYLRRFPIDRVKIDREFVAEIDKSRSNRAIVSAIVAMAHGLDLAVTAEGVETEAQVEFLREQKCEEVQGFLFGRPAPMN
ncbi:MAG TPA: EAL domain-containing protein [Thermoanaerobaculia bacterium]|jgi:diguanylate cyclase (GGDEF)-like protein/PAS domain S-box-containing protein|nr:EAL domain-containing protein [Thermoanaerobaculia bacterium]